MYYYVLLHIIKIFCILLHFTDCNVGLGLGLYGEKYTLRTSFISLWTYIGYACIIIILQVVLHVLFFILAMKAPLHGRHNDNIYTHYAFVDSFGFICCTSLISYDITCQYRLGIASVVIINFTIFSISELSPHYICVCVYVCIVIGNKSVNLYTLTS